MANLAAGDITYTLLSENIADGGKVRRTFALTTAAGEYPTGGLPLDNNKMGYPVALDSLNIMEENVAAVTHHYKWDRSTNKLLCYIDDAVTGIPAQHANSTYTSPDQLIVEVLGW